MSWDEESQFSSQDASRRDAMEAFTLDTQSGLVKTLGPPHRPLVTIADKYCIVVYRGRKDGIYLTP